MIAFNDLHNFHMPVEEYKSLFNSEYLNIKLSIESKSNSVSPLSRTNRHSTFTDRVSARDRSEVWNNKTYPNTVKENVQILDDYLTLCEKKDLRSILFLPPLSKGYMQYFSRQKLDEFYCLVRDAQKKHPSTIFFDAWKLPPFLDTDFADEGHMNIQGAAKFSAIFNDLIEQLER